MFSFRDLVENDIKNVFLNLDEHGTRHVVEGSEITCIFDDEALRERQSGNELGVAESNLLLFAHVDDLPSAKDAGEHLEIDGKEYIVDDWSVNERMAQIALSQVKVI